MPDKPTELEKRETRAGQIAGLLDEQKVHEASEKLRESILTELTGANFARLTPSDTKKVTDLLELVASKDVKNKGKDIELEYDTSNLMNIRVKGWKIK